MQFNIDDEDDDPVLIAEGHPQYNKLQKKTEELQKTTRRAAKYNGTYKEVKKVLEELRDEAVMGLATGEQDEENEKIVNEEEKKRGEQRKKRKILKPFREYTVRQGEEGKFKGWSKRAAIDMAALCKHLKEDKKDERGGRFRAAYREIYLLCHLPKPRATEKEDDPVDYSELWDGGDIIPVAINPNIMV